MEIPKGAMSVIARVQLRCQEGGQEAGSAQISKGGKAVFSFGACARREQESLTWLTEGAPGGSPPTLRPWVNGTGTRSGKGLSPRGMWTVFLCRLVIACF